MNSLRIGLAACAIVACVAGPAQAQDNPDFRIRAEFRTADDGTWPDNQSVGHAEFRVVSRFGQVYYGGVIRQDEYRFTVQVDFSEASDMETEFPGSPYNVDYDVYINSGFVGRLDMNAQTLGFGELQYDSRHPTAPALPLPANFPSPVNTGDMVRLFAAAPVLPAMGDALPAGTALLENALGEEFARGDADQDGEVNETDFAFLASNFDPFLLTGNHMGPVAGDFTGDNRSTMADYTVMAANWTGDTDIPPPPAPIATPGCDAIDFNQDGLFPDTLDIDDFLSVFAGGPCSTGACGDIDFNNDLLFPDTADIDALLSVFSGGACV